MTNIHPTEKQEKPFEKQEKATENLALESFYYIINVQPPMPMTRCRYDEILYNLHELYLPSAEAAIQRCSQEKLFGKDVANLQENSNAEV